MPSPLNETNIIAPRVPIIDERSGLISREWYRFFLNLFVLTGGGRNDTSLLDLQVGPPTQPYIDIHSIDPTPVSFAAYAAGSTQESQIAELQKQIEGLETQVCCQVSEVAELQKQIEGLQVQPQFDISAINAAIAATSTAPVTKIADFTVASNESWIINNKSGSSCTVTLPTASSNIGRELYFLNYQAQTLVSASSNVVPLVGGSATTAILEAVAGSNATLVSDGTNWIMMQYDSNNALQLE
jgi:hypothetical protein